MSVNIIRVQIIYRNYKPLHENYSSFRKFPPEGIKFLIPKPRLYLSRLRPLYVQLGDKWPVRSLILLAQKYLFDNKNQRSETADLYHYLHMLPGEIPAKPFIVDIEHIAALANFVPPAEKEKMLMVEKLSHERCKKIIVLSNAAKKSLAHFFKEDFGKIEHKTEVVYPALPHYTEIFVEPDHSIMAKSTFNLLFVGQNPYGKGLVETIQAVQKLCKRYPDIVLHIISKASRSFVGRYRSESILFYPWGFTKDTVIKKFFMPADLFVLPTRGDTFGMAILDALSSGTPVISSRQYAIPEIIDNQRNGFLIKTKYNYLDSNVFPSREIAKQNKTEIPDQDVVEALCSTIETLYRNRELLQNFAKNTGKEFSGNGKFSIGIRNQKLKRIYRAALSN